MRGAAWDWQPARLRIGAQLPAVLLLSGLIAATFTLARAQPAEPIREAWRRPLGSVQCLAISLDGTRTAIVTWTSEVLCWDGNRLKWRRRVPGAEAVVLGAGGLAVIYTPLDALRRDLLILDGDGHVRRRATAGGPITTLSLSPSGRSAAVGTADGAVEVHGLVFPFRSTDLALPGACRQLGFDSRDDLVVSTDPPAWLSVFDSAGRRLWRAAAPVGCEFRIATPPCSAPVEHSGPLTIVAVVPAVPPAGTAAKSGPVRRAIAQSAQPGSTLVTGKLGNSAPKPGRDEIQLVAYSATGKLIWRHTLKGRAPNLRLMESTGEVVVAYERAERRGATQRYNRVLACFDGTGQPRREQGGMVYNPLLVSAAPDGRWVLSLCSGNRFWLLSGRGQSLWSFTSRAPVRMVRASANGASVAVYTSDGQLSMLKISPAVSGSHHGNAEVADRGTVSP
jgi:hypothetical protein